MKKLHQKLKKLERRLSCEHGDLTLFGLFQEASSCNWDVVVSASWAPEGILDANRMLVDEANKDLTSKEMRMLRAFFVRPTNSFFVQEMVQRYPTDPLGKARLLSGIEVDGRHMDSVVIFAAKSSICATLEK